jgi:hypothetical protein
MDFFRWRYLALLRELAVSGKLKISYTSIS